MRVARRGGRSSGGEFSRAVIQLIVAVVAVVAVLALLNSGVFKAIGSQVGQNLASTLASNLAAKGATPAPGTTWTTADYDACSAAYEAVKTWPGRQAMVAVDQVLYGGATDGKAARDAIRTASSPFLTTTASLHPTAAPTELARFRSDLSAFVTAAAQPMTVTDVRTRYNTIASDVGSLGYRCGQVRTWIQQNVPQQGAPSAPGWLSSRQPSWHPQVDTRAMTRRADLEGIYLARRAAVLSIPTTSGVSADRAEALVREWEADAEARGMPRLERTFWEDAAEWTSSRAHPKRPR